MTEDEAKTLAAKWIRDHAKDPDFLSITEAYDLDGDNAEKVYELINRAKVEVSW